MSSNSWSFRRRTIGRAASPPTWACYEQIHYDDSDSCSDDISCSEDEDDYGALHGRAAEESDQEERSPATPPTGPDSGDAQAMDMHIDHDHTEEDGSNAHEQSIESKKDIKGKQKAVDVEPETPQRRHRRKPRRSADCALRPILTIHKSQGFVWNQDLFVPPYIMDRYIASTSPPDAKGLMSSSSSLPNSTLRDYVEVVEIRVNESDLDDFYP